MKWLKAKWKAIAASTLGTAVLAVLAVFAVAAAQRSKATAKKWQDKAVDIEEGNVVKGVETAEAASAQAKLHEQKAEARKAKAEAHIEKLGGQNEDISIILDNFRKSS